MLYGCRWGRASPDGWRRMRTVDVVSSTLKTTFCCCTHHVSLAHYTIWFRDLWSHDLPQSLLQIIILFIDDTTMSDTHASCALVDPPLQKNNTVGIFYNGYLTWRLGPVCAMCADIYRLRQEVRYLCARRDLPVQQ